MGEVFRNYQFKYRRNSKAIQVFNKGSNTCQNDDKFKTEQLTFMAHKIFINVTELLQAKKNRSYRKADFIHPNKKNVCCPPISSDIAGRQRKQSIFYYRHITVTKT